MILLISQVCSTGVGKFINLCVQAILKVLGIDEGMDSLGVLVLFHFWNDKLVYVHIITCSTGDILGHVWIAWCTYTITHVRKHPVWLA